MSPQYPFAPQWDRPIAPTNLPLIISMWLLTVVSMISSILFGMLACVMLDVPSVIAAIYLVCTKNTANRVNGWIKLGIEIAAFFYGFIMAFMGARGAY